MMTHQSPALSSTAPAHRGRVASQGQPSAVRSLPSAKAAGSPSRQVTVLESTLLSPLITRELTEYYNAYSEHFRAPLIKEPRVMELRDILRTLMNGELDVKAMQIFVQHGLDAKVAANPGECVFCGTTLGKVSTGTENQVSGIGLGLRSKLYPASVSVPKLCRICLRHYCIKCRGEGKIDIMKAVINQPYKTSKSCKDCLRFLEAFEWHRGQSNQDSFPLSSKSIRAAQAKISPLVTKLHRDITQLDGLTRLKQSTSPVPAEIDRTLIDLNEEVSSTLAQLESLAKAINMIPVGDSEPQANLTVRMQVHRSAMAELQKIKPKYNVLQRIIRMAYNEKTPPPSPGAGSHMAR